VGIRRADAARGEKESRLTPGSQEKCEEGRDLRKIRAPCRRANFDHQENQQGSTVRKRTASGFLAKAERPQRPGEEPIRPEGLIFMEENLLRIDTTRKISKAREKRIGLSREGEK